MTEFGPSSAVAETVHRTRLATAVSLRRGDARTVFAGVTVGYLVTYLFAIGHLGTGLGGFDLVVVDDPARRFFRPALGPLSFEPVARVTIGPVTYLFSFDTVLGAALSALVGLNLAVTYVAWRQPAACGIARSSTGLLASLPAIVSGTACCGPVVLIALGIQLSGTLLTAFQFLLPIGAALLVASLLLVGRRVDPATIR